MFLCLQGNGGTGPVSAEEGVEDVAGGTYVRFDAPKAKIRKSWPGVRGTSSFSSSLLSAQLPSDSSRWVSALWNECLFVFFQPDMILHRYVVSRVIWAYMLSIAVTYSITLCLFPGLESEIRNHTLGEWLPILIMATFNMSDFVGKVSTACFEVFITKNIMTRSALIRSL